MRRRSRGRRALLPLAVVATLTTTALAANANDTEPPSAAPLLDLTWSAPAECPDKDSVVAEVSDLVVGPHPVQKPLVADGKIARRAPNAPYVLELRIGGEASSRTMTGIDCTRLASAAALVLALDIDAGALERGSSPPEAASSEPTSTELPPPPASPARARTKSARPLIGPRPQRPSLEVTLGPRFVLDVGSLPRETAGVAAALAVARKALALELQATGYERRFTMHGPRNGLGGAYVDLVTFAAHGCGRSLVAGIEWRGCLGAELGRESTEGVSIARPLSSSTVWGAVSGMFRARAWPDRVLSPTVGLVVGAPVKAAEVVIDGFHTVFEPPAVFVRALLGIEAKLF
jgi:hypothetical protein